MSNHFVNFNESPDAFKRLGNNVFLKIPLYRSVREYVPVYINTALYYRYICDAHTSWQQMSCTLLENFSVTINAANAAGEAMGYAYADRQSDPLGISLHGNLGSGRAYYLGQHFNIKGEITPLCTSADPRFSDGIMDMERGIWETMMSNLLYEDTQIQVPPILAILDMREECYVRKRETMGRRIKIIRIDDGALDRVTHVFFSKTPVTQSALVNTAQQFGQQEGDKFIERIIHGAWSPGNIGLNGNVIDFDTVCSTKGRCPQYSSSAWHAATYFGYEGQGQKLILNSLANDMAINIHAVPPEQLEDAFHTQWHRRIACRIMHLAGFANSEHIYTQHQTGINQLTDYFILLSRKFYPKLTSLSMKTGGSCLFHVVDFSIFFRAYPLLKRLDRFHADECVDLMMNTSLLHEPLVHEEKDWPLEEEDLYFKTHALAAFSEHCVDTQAALEEVRRHLLDFVLLYDRIISAAYDSGSTSIEELEARAYVINEDRLYLFPSFTPSCLLSQESTLTPEQVSTRIQAFIDASRRTPIKETHGYRADMRIFKQGIYQCCLNGEGSHHYQVILWINQEILELIHTSRTCQLMIDGTVYDININVHQTFIHLIGPLLPNSILCDQFHRDYSLMIKDIIVLINGNEVILTDYLEGS